MSRNPLKLRYSLHLFPLLFALLASLGGCNKNDTIGGLGKPLIELDSETGVYTVKVGKPLTVRPTFKNVKDDEVRWLMDNQLIGRGFELVYTWDQETTAYIMIEATNSSGTTREEIRVEVMGLTPPVISLFLPDGGLKLTPGHSYTIVPDIQHSDMEGFRVQWYIDDRLAGEEPDLTLSLEDIGVYRMKIVATNIDGSDTKEFDVEVVDELPRAVSFLPPSYYCPSTERYTFPGRPVFLTPLLTDFSDPRFSWEIDGELQTDHGASLKFAPANPGEYIIKVKVVDNDGINPQKPQKPLSRSVILSSEYSAEVKVVCVDATEASRMRPESQSSQADFDKIYEWLPAPGQFVNDAAMKGAEASLETAVAWAADMIKSNNPVSLGALGGYIIAGFDHSVVAGGTEDYDFEVGGNAFNNASGNNNEPGIVWVMQDVNGNGLPDDEWYQLKGSEYSNPKTIHNYAVTYFRPDGPESDVVWADNLGQTGKIDYVATFHNQPYYYPQWMEASTYTLYGTRLPDNNVYDEAKGYWSNNPFEWGYADNLGTDNIEAPRGQWTGFRISNAVYPDGTPASLEYIDFVKVQTGIQTKSGHLGEGSTEVTGFRDTSLK